MLPTDMKDFLVATVTASASFIGLLFVAISFIDSEKLSKAELQTKRVLAESSYAALLSIFFISLVGLIPNTGVGWPMTVLGITGLWNVSHFVQRGKRQEAFAFLGLSFVVYVCQVVYGITLIFAPDSDVTSRYAFMTLMLFLFSIALGRAWSLTGIRPDRTTPRD